MTETPLNVVHLVGQLRMGGMEKLLVEFARHADRKRFNLHFVSLGDKGDLGGDIEACGWPVTALDTPPGLRPGLVLRLARLFRRLRADVVHTHNSNPLIYGALAARLARVPRVVHTRHGQGYQAKGRQKLALRLASRLADRIVCVSEDSRKLSAEDGFALHQLCTIRNGIDVAHFQEAGPCPGGPAVMVARLSPVKGIDTLIHAVALVVRKRPDFRLELAGDGVCLADLRQLTSDLGLEANVHFLGTVKDVAGLLSKASLFVLHSLSEGISLTILEAMSKGLPVVTTRVGGSPEVVVHGQTGLLVPAGDPASLADALLRVYNSPEEARQMGRAGRQRVEREFAITRTIAAYEELYVGRSGFPDGADPATASGSSAPALPGVPPTPE